MSLQKVTSRANPKLKAVRRLLKSGFGTAAIVVEGEKLIHEAMAAGLSGESVWCTEPPTFSMACPVFQLPNAVYGTISPTKSGRAPLVVFPTPKIETIHSQSQLMGSWLLLDQIQDPGNAGALVRAAMAFGFCGILWHQPTVFPFHHACIRASAGAVFHLSHGVVGESFLSDHDLDLVVGDLDGTALEQFKWPTQAVLALGNEGHGLSEAILQNARYRVHIPIDRRTESLNVAGAGHILMYHFQHQKKVTQKK